MVAERHWKKNLIGAVATAEGFLLVAMCPPIKQPLVEIVVKKITGSFH